MANESFSFEEAIGLQHKPLPGRAADSGGFSFEEALGNPAQASPGFIPTIKRTGGQMLTSAATAAEDVVGANAVTRAVHEAGQGIIDRNPAGIRSLRDLADSPWLAVKESVGQFAPQIVAAAAGGAVGAKAGAALGSIAGPAGAAVGGTIGGVAGSLLPIFTLEYGGIRQEQKESGQEDKARALAAAIPATALERVGMGKALNVLKGMPGGAAGTVLKEAGKGVLKEGATEGAQNVIEQWGAFKDPTKAENLEDTALSAAMGGIGGGVMGAGAGAVDGMRHRAQERADLQASQAAADAQAMAEQADPTINWTTEAGAADPSAPIVQRTELPDAPDLQTSPGAAPPREGALDFTRDVDTSGLGLEDPVEVERARAATMDYEPGDATPQWDTARGAAQDRQPGLDLQGAEFDTGGLDFQDDLRAPSQRMGIDPMAGPLSRNVATAIDSAAAQGAQFLGATGRELQVRRASPGLANDSNVIDVQGRVVEDRAIGTPRRLTTDPAGGLPAAADAIEPINRTGEPLRLDVAHALRSQAVEAGIPVSVVRHASGQGYDVVPRLPAPAVVAAPGGAPFSTPAAAQAELQRQQLGRTHEVMPTGGDSSLGFVLQKKGQNQTAALDKHGQVAINSIAERVAGWRSNALQASRVARGLGIDPRGKRLAQVVAEIDAADSAQNQDSTVVTQALAAIESVAEPSALHEANGPNLPSNAKSTPMTRAGDIARGLREDIDNVAAQERRPNMYRQEAKRLRDAANGMAGAGDVRTSFIAAADMLDAWAGQPATSVEQEGTSAPRSTTSKIAPENIAANADVKSAGVEFNHVPQAAQRQDQAAAPRPRKEPEVNSAQAPADKAQEAINSGVKSPTSGSGCAHGAAPRSTTRIDDFGETLHGARKMLYAEAYADGMAKAKELDTKAHPLSKTWPEPDYLKLLDGGARLEAVSIARALRDAVPTKPQSSWKLKGWATQVEMLRGFAEDALSGQQETSAVRIKLNRDGMPRGIADKAALYESMGHEWSLKGIEVSVGRYSMYDRVEYNPPRTIWSVSREAKGSSFGNWPRELAMGDTREAAIAAFKKRAAELLAEEQAPTKGATFEIYSKRAGGAREFFIGKKIGRNVAELKAGFTDLNAARQYKADHQVELEELLTKHKAVPPVRNTQNAPRIGEDYRQGADVSPAQFQEAFGFRGVQFGNYVEGARRQQDLNRAYDALMDLAGVLNLPPRALSLGGRLGLAFGARGTGGTDAAAAHYERGNVVINLTKREGAGSLAHEWWHGLDNYFSRQRGDGDSYMTSDSRSGDGVREEMRAAFRAVMSAINLTGMQERSRKLDDRRTKEYWTTKPEMSARAFESYVISKLQDQNAGNDYLANVVGDAVFALEGAYPYPTAGELPQIREALDAFFQTVQTREEAGGAVVLYNTSDKAPPVRGLSLEEAQQAVQQALAGLASPPPVNIVVRSEEAWVGAPEGVMGAAIPKEGRIVLVASAHGSTDAVVETLFHEMFHLGVHKVLPTPDYVQSMLDLAKRDSRVQRYAIEWKEKAPDAPHQLRVLRERGYSGSELTARYEALAIEEGLAVVAEELRAQKQTGTRLGLRVRTLANWLASVAERMGMQRLAERIRKMTYNEAERFVLRAIEHAGRASIDEQSADGARYRTSALTETSPFQSWFADSQVVNAAGKPLQVFHGTGSDFSVFTRGRAGATSRAANAGMGFFFTDRPEIADTYARMAGEAQSIMPVYLSLQNPLRLNAKNMMEADRLLMSGLKPENDGAIIQVAMRDGGTQTVYMARDPDQIKSATGNNGQFDPGNPDVRFRTQRVGDTLQALTVPNLKQQAGFKVADYRGLGLQFLGRRQLVDVYGDMLPELRRYSDLMARMDADKNEAGAGADQLATDWAKLPDERQLAELMHDSTLAQIDPSQDFVDGDNKTDWTRLRAKYQALSPAAKDVYARARDTYRQHMRDVRSAIKERIERAEMSSERRTALLKRMDDEFFGHIKGVYFPLARFGQYVVVVKGADGKVENVSRAETMAEADATRRQLVAAFPQAKGFTVGKVIKAKDFVAERDTVGRGFMEQLYGVLDKQGMDAKQRAELEDALGQLYLSSLPDLSWAKHGIHRKGTAGFSQDARRAFAQNVFHGAS